MPVFHTKTIQSILEPVAEQVSYLVILHEEGEDSNSMPSLEAPIKAVDAAVQQLANVGRAQIATSKDEVLKLDTPPALEKVETSSSMLLNASRLLAADPHSEQGRVELINGSRGILQGTSDLLLVFDENEVRKICKTCRNVRDYLKVSEVVQGMEDLVTYVKNLTPGTTSMSRMVGQRSEDLTSNKHAGMLKTEMEHVKELVPGLVSSMKVYVTTVNNEGKGGESAKENREYYVKQIAAAITEIIRVLQLVSTDNDIDFEPMGVMQVLKTRERMAKNMTQARDWLNDPNAPAGGPGEMALRDVVDGAREVGMQIGGRRGEQIQADCNKIADWTDKLSELRANGKGNSPEARQLAQNIDRALQTLLGEVDQAIQELQDLEKAHANMMEKMNVAKEWLSDPSAQPGEGSKAVHDMTQSARAIASKLHGPGAAKDREDINKLCQEIDEMMNKLEDYRAKGLGHTPEARLLAKQISDKIGLLNAKVAKALATRQPPATLDEKMEEAEKWLENPGVNDEGRGAAATRGVLSEARRIASTIQDPEKRFALLKNIAGCERLLAELENLIKLGQGDTPRARQIAQELQEKLAEVRKQMKEALIEAVADEFSDTTTALKQLTTAANAPANAPNREENFDEKALAFNSQAMRLAGLARQAVAASDHCTNEKMAEVNKMSGRIEDLTPQVINAGRIVLQNPGNKAASDHFDNLKNEWTSNMDDLTGMVDDSVDVAAFVKASEEGMRRDHAKCVTAIKTDCPAEALPLAGNISRRAHRVLITGKREADNVEDLEYTTKLKSNLQNVQSVLQPTLTAAREYAADPRNRQKQDNFIQQEEKLIDSVSQVRNTMEAKVIADEMKQMKMEEPPPVPPLPSGEQAPPRPPLPAEPEEQFPEEDVHNHDDEIYSAAKELHEEAKKWESKGNDIIAAAKKMALLMAKMSKLVRGEGGSRKDLIQCAKDIAKASNEVTRLAREVANKCTDKRIRNDMLKTIDRIPTISTQLRILSTVKATTLGNAVQEREEDAEQATEMLVHNAQNLMQSVKETVRYAEAASIRIRTDAGLTMRWVRKGPQY